MSFVAISQALAKRCVSKSGPNGRILYSTQFDINTCWDINVPSNSYIRLNLTNFDINSRSRVSEKIKILTHKKFNMKFKCKNVV